MTSVQRMGRNDIRVMDGKYVILRNEVMKEVTVLATFSSSLLSLARRIVWQSLSLNR